MMARRCRWLRLYRQVNDKVRNVILGNLEINLFAYLMSPYGVWGLGGVRALVRMHAY